MATAMLENSIQKVKDSIESRQFIPALKLIKELESQYPSSAQVLVLKALVYARTGHTEALSICSHAVEKALTDTSVLPDVLNISQIICQCLGHDKLAITFYEKAGAEDSNNLDMMMGLFQCYVRESSFIKQLKISLKMYKLSREDKFLMWAVFSIQLQVVSHLIKKHATTHNLDEPKALLVYISVPQQQGEYGHAREILSMLGTTLLVGEVSKLHIKGDMLLARLSDYAAAMEILRQKLETCPDNWKCFLNDLGRLLEHDSLIHPSLVLACKLSEDEFMQNQFGTKLSDALTLNLANLPMEVCGCLDGNEYDGLDEVANEYFNRLGAGAEVSLHISRKSEELHLINYLREQNRLSPALLWKEVENFLVRVEESSVFIHDRVSAYRGTSIAFKTSRFIILASDGLLSTENNSEGLDMKADKVWGFDDLGAGICGSWKTLSNTVSMLKRSFEFCKDKGAKRPTVSKLADSLKEKLSSCEGKSGIILGAFDQLQGGVLVPCISFADGCRTIDVNESFFCLGTGERHAKKILSGGNVHMEMSLEEAINLVERALLYASIRDSCTGGYASIYVIEVGKPARAIAREQICTTLWRRHHLSLPGHPLSKHEG